MSLSLLQRAFTGMQEGHPEATQTLLRELIRRGIAQPFRAATEILENWLLETLEPPTPGAAWQPPPFDESALTTFASLWEEEGLAHAALHAQPSWWSVLENTLDPEELPHIQRLLQRMEHLAVEALDFDPFDAHEGQDPTGLALYRIQLLTDRKQEAQRTLSTLIDGSWRFVSEDVLRFAFADDLRLALRRNPSASAHEERFIRWQALDPYGALLRLRILAQEAPDLGPTPNRWNDFIHEAHTLGADSILDEPEHNTQLQLLCALLHLRLGSPEASAALQQVRAGLSELGEVSDALRRDLFLLAAAGYTEPLLPCVMDTGIDDLIAPIHAFAAGVRSEHDLATAAPIWTLCAELHAMGHTQLPISVTS